MDVGLRSCSSCGLAPRAGDRYCSRCGAALPGGRSRERRTLATFQALWPELQLVVTSPQIDFESYPNAEISRDDVIHIMLGDLQRLRLYAEKGWSAPQQIPAEVLAAYDRLVAAGYTRRLIPSE